MGWRSSKTKRKGKIMQKITNQMMKQYEAIRKSGVCNMYDYYAVQQEASATNFYALASLSREEYKILLINFNYLMKKYKIKQE